MNHVSEVTTQFVADDFDLALAEMLTIGSGSQQGFANVPVVDLVVGRLFEQIHHIDFLMCEALQGRHDFLDLPIGHLHLPETLHGPAELQFGQILVQKFRKLPFIDLDVTQFAKGFREFGISLGHWVGEREALTH